MLIILKYHMYMLSHVQLFVTTWTVAHQVPLSMGFPRQGHWSELPFPHLGDLPDPGIEPVSPVSPALAGKFFTTESSRKHMHYYSWVQIEQQKKKILLKMS